MQHVVFKTTLSICVYSVSYTHLAKVKAADGYVYYMAVALLDTVLGKLAEEGKPAYEILETYKGQDLEYKEYDPLYQCAADCAADVYKRQELILLDQIRCQIQALFWRKPAA